MNKTTELLPCPFCGGEAKFTIKRHPNDLETTDYLKCKKCGIETDPFPRRECIEKWNARAESSARIEQLEAENLALKTLAVAAVRFEQACDGLVPHYSVEKERQALSEAAEKVKAILEASK